MYVPDGIAGLLWRQTPLITSGQFHRVLPHYLLAFAPGFVAAAGLSMIVEMSHQLTVNAPEGPEMSFAGTSHSMRHSLLAWAACHCDCW
jgi:branched-chain amino acid transport system permease protein